MRAAVIGAPVEGAAGEYGRSRYLTGWTHAETLGIVRGAGRVADQAGLIVGVKLSAPPPRMIVPVSWVTTFHDRR